MWFKFSQVFFNAEIMELHWWKYCGLVLKTGKYTGLIVKKKGCSYNKLPLPSFFLCHYYFKYKQAKIDC